MFKCIEKVGLSKQLFLSLDYNNIFTFTKLSQILKKCLKFIAYKVFLVDSQPIPKLFGIGNLPNDEI